MNFQIFLLIIIILLYLPKVGRNDPCPCGSGKKYKNAAVNRRTSPSDI
ncbi:MAG: SEC-C domain-containing protein [Victivallaceae bacterium]|nr:SEC-C domain-containing protein [Victivallaceae bacterium]